MTRKNALRVLVASLLLVAAVGVAQAFFPLSPVSASVFRFTSSPVRSTVEVGLQNPNGSAVVGTLSVVVVRPNGVTHSVSARNVVVPAGSSTYQLYVPYDIAGARFARYSIFN